MKCENHAPGEKLRMEKKKIIGEGKKRKEELR
jgi:hypothetical protein